MVERAIARASRCGSGRVSSVGSSRSPQITRSSGRAIEKAPRLSFWERKRNHVLRLPLFVFSSCRRSSPSLKGIRSLGPLSAACLDPAYPLVAVVLEGVRALAENPHKADLVARLVTDLRERLCDGSRRIYRNDTTFSCEIVTLRSAAQCGDKYCG